MDYKTGLLLITFLVGCFALPTPENDFFFYRYEVAPRIVGGNQADAGSHPHMVALSRGALIRSFFCGGSLISQRTVLTAAHCVRGSFGGIGNLGNTRATVGTNRWNSGGTQYHITRGVMHPNYDHSNIKNDVAVLITSINVVLNNLVQVVPLSYNNVGGGVPALVAGFGAIRANGAASAVLLEVQLTTLSGEQCENDVRSFATVNNVRAPLINSQVEICTFRGVGHGTCQGDSGSALRRVDNGQQIGVVSWGFPCALGAPDVYARVSGFQNFIESNSV